MTIALTLQAGTTFARTATVAMPNYPSPPAGAWRLDFVAAPGDVPVLSFSSADGSIGVNAFDSGAQTVSLAFLAAAQDSLNIPAGSYSGYLVFADGNGAEQAGDVFALTVSAAASGATLPPAPSYSDIAAWGPLTDIAGTPTATLLQMLPRGLSGPTGPAPWTTPVAWAPYTAYGAIAPASAVTWNSSAYVCTTAHISGAAFDASNWQELAPGAGGAVQAAQAAATAAARSALSLLFIGNFGALVSAWFAGLPTSLPSADGVWWNDGGIPAQTSGGVAPAMPSPLTTALFGAAMNVWFGGLPTALPPRLGAWWNNGGLPAWTTPDAATAAALTALAALAPFDFGAALSAWFATLPILLPSTSGQFWNDSGIIARS